MSNTKDKLFGTEKDGLLFSHYAVMVWDEQDNEWATWSEEPMESDALDWKSYLEEKGDKVEINIVYR
jgi:hypothetical protein